MIAVVFAYPLWDEKVYRIGSEKEQVEADRIKQIFVGLAAYLASQPTEELIVFASKQEIFEETHTFAALLRDTYIDRKGKGISTSVHREESLNACMTRLARLLQRRKRQGREVVILGEEDISHDLLTLAEIHLTGVTYTVSPVERLRP